MSTEDESNEWDEDDFQRVEENYHELINNYNTEVLIGRAAGDCKQIMLQACRDWDFDNKDDVEEIHKYIDEDEVKNVILGCIYKELRQWLDYEEVDLQLFEELK